MHATKEMEQNLETPLSLVELADRTGVSKRTLHRLFQEHTDLSPMQYYRDRRLLHARQLILQSDFSVTQAAFAAGFSSLPAFSRAFQKRYGCSPFKLKIEIDAHGNRIFVPATSTKLLNR